MDDDGRRWMGEYLNLSEREIMLHGQRAVAIELPSPLGRWVWNVRINHHRDEASRWTHWNFVVRAASLRCIGAAGSETLVSPRSVAPSYPETDPADMLVEYDEWPGLLECGLGRQISDHMLASARHSYRIQDDVLRGAAIEMISRLKDRVRSASSDPERAEELFAPLLSVVEEGLGRMLDEILERSSRDHSIGDINVVPEALRDVFRSVGASTREVATRFEELSQAVTAARTVDGRREDYRAEERATAMVLLRTVLGEEAHREIKTNKGYTVTGESTGYLYRLRIGEMTLRYSSHLTPNVNRNTILCFELEGGYHPVDTLIAEALMIATDEERYLSIAIKQG